MPRLRQLVHDLVNRLLAVPSLFVAGAVLLALGMPAVDGSVDEAALPDALLTTVDGGRATLSAIAGGLITSTTLLLSLVLVAVQLGSTQFSPRTMWAWTGDRTQQVAIGLVLGTSMYCLLILRATRQIDDGSVPHLSVLLAVVLGLVSLIAVLRAVDDLTRQLRVDSVITRLTERTVALVERWDDDRPDGPVEVGGSVGGAAGDAVGSIDGAGTMVTAERSGRVQQIDEEALARALAPSAVAELAVDVGSFVLPGGPLVEVRPAPDPDRLAAVRRAVVIGDERTLQHDVGFGIVQLVDIALRALSPGVNDPNTANEVVAHLGVILLAIWERTPPPARRHRDGRTIVRQPLDHGQLLDDAIAPIRRHGSGDAAVVVTLVGTLDQLRSEVRRRGLPGPVEPIAEAIAAVVDDFTRTGPAPADRRLVDAALVGVSPVR